MSKQSNKVEAWRSFMHVVRSRAIAVAVLLVAFAVTVFAAFSTSVYTVSIVDEAKQQTITTTREDPMDILAQAQIKVGKNDQINIAQFQPGEGGSIAISRSKNINIDHHGTVRQYTVLGLTVKEVLAEAGITMEQDDAANYELSDAVSEGMLIKISKTFPVTLIENGKEQTMQVTQGTVADVLSAAGVEMNGEKEISPAAAEPLKDNLRITVSQLSYVEKTVTESIPFETETIKTDSMYVGERRTAQSGANGEQTVKYRVKLLDGKEASKEKLSSTVTKAARTEKIKVGTKKKPSKIHVQAGFKTISELNAPSWLKVNNDAEPSSYKRIVEGKGTAYSGGGTTATGRKAMPGHVAVDPKEIPYGSKLWIVSTDGKYVYGYAIAADTGGFAKGNRILTDLYFNTDRECRRFGVRDVRIYVLD